MAGAYPHSQAPWSLGSPKRPRWTDVRAADGARVCEVAFWTGEDVGDALLIVAAPEMYAALLALVADASPCNLDELAEDDPEQHEAWRLAKAALQRATWLDGESPWEP